MTTQDCRYLDPSWDFEKIYHERAYVSDLTRAEFERAIADGGTELYPLRRGIDFYHEYKQDIALFKELGLKIFRTSFCWARIFPTGEEETPNEEGLAYYRDMFRTLKDNDIKIFATIQHYDIPVSLVEKYGGWKHRRLVDLFVRYVKVLFTEFGDMVDYWLPFNEINAARFAHWDGISVLIDETEDMETTIYQSLHHQFVANAKIVRMAKQMLGRNNIGAMIAAFTIYPGTCKPADVLQAFRDEQFSNYFYFDVMAKGAYPKYMLKYFRDHHVTIEMEDGTVHDDYRIQYLKKHIGAMKDAIDDGVELIGYTMWGIIDIVSCGPLTMDKRYGVIYVDRDNEGKGSNKRYKKESFTWYQKCIASNGEE